MPLLFVRLYSNQGKSLMLEVDEDDTIGEVKERIGRLHQNIPPRLLELYHGSRRLRDDKTLRQYKIDSATFSGYVYVNQDIELRIIPQSGKPFIVRLEPHKKVQTLKERIVREQFSFQQNIDADKIELIYYGRKLPNDRSLEACHLKQNSQLYMAVLNEERVFRGTIFKSMNFLPSQTVLRKTNFDVTRSISMARLGTLREEQRHPEIIQRLPLLRPSYVYTQNITNRNLNSLLLE